MRLLQTCLALLFAPLAFAGEAAAPTAPPADKAAEKALADIEKALATGELGWWRSEVDPAIQFTAKYTGVSGDAITAFTLNQAEKIWPAWKSVSERMDNFGAACVVYNCLKYSYDGQYNKAALEGMKWFLMNRLKQIGEHGAISASGVGLIDFALNSFGEAAMQQIKDDYWIFYCQYQFERHPHLRDYARLIKDGDGREKGFPALAASLDTFWEVPEAQAIRGYFTLSAQDPDFVATFRNRFIKQNVLAFLLQWAEHEQEKARTAAWLAAKKFTEQLQSTTFVLEVPIRDRGLNEAPAGLTADFYVFSYGAPDNLKLLGSAPVTRDLKFEVPLASLFNAKGELSHSVTVKLRREGPRTPNSAPQPDTFGLYLREENSAWKRDAQPGRLVYRPRDPLWVSCYSEIRVSGGGTGPNRIPGVVFYHLPRPGQASLNDSCSRPHDYGCSLSDGKGTTTLANGRYLVVATPPLTAETVVTVRGNMEFSISPSNSGGTAPPQIPDPTGIKELNRQTAAAVRSRTSRADNAALNSVEARSAWWESALKALTAGQRAVKLIELKMNEDARRPGITNSESAVIINSAQAKMREVGQSIGAIQAVFSKVESEAREEATAVEQEQAQRIAAVTKEYEESKKAVAEILAKLRAVLTPLESGFVEVTRGVTQGHYYSLVGPGTDAAEKQLEKARVSAAQIEKDVPLLAAERTRLKTAAARYAQAKAAVRDADERDGKRISPGSVVPDEEINAVETRAEILDNPRIVRETRDHVRRGERMLERRKEHRRRTEEGLRKIEETGAAMPAVDEARWQARTAEFVQTATQLFAAASAPAGAEDTPVFKNLASAMDAFFHEQIEVCGDLLEPPDRKETTFSRYETAFRNYLELTPGADEPADFSTRRASAAKKLGARNRAVATAFKIRRDVRVWLATGPTRAQRSASLAQARTTLSAPLTGRDVAARLAALQEKTRLLESLPVKLPSTEERKEFVQRLEAERATLAESGELEELWLARHEPFVVFASVNGRAYNRAFYRKVEDRHRLPNNSQPTAMLKVMGLEEGTFYTLRRSNDGGKTWFAVETVNGHYVTRLPITATTRQEFLLKAVLPGKKETPVFPGLPQFAGP